VQQSRQQARTVRVVVLVRAVVVPVICAVMIVVMAAGSGQRIAHASQHASDSALQHINIYDPEAGAKQMQQRQAGTCLLAGTADRRPAENL
jgi:hypothetical protein